MKFNIVIARAADPKFSVHAECLLPVAEVLKFGLRDLGHDADLGNTLDRSCQNIVLGYHNFAGKELPSDYDCIIYQLEQFPGYKNDPYPHLLKMKEKALVTLKSAKAIWDYSEQNIDFLAEKNIDALYKPIGFHPKMERINHRTDKDVDFLFYGCNSERRHKILQVLADEYNFRSLFGVYGEQRDRWIARSKIVVDIHFFESKLFDEVRTSYLMNNRAFFILEETPHKKYTDTLVYASFDDFVETCKYYIERPTEIKKKAELAFENFSKYKESAFLEEVLDKTFAEN